MISVGLRVLYFPVGVWRVWMARFHFRWNEKIHALFYQHFGDFLPGISTTKINVYFEYCIKRSTLWLFEAERRFKLQFSNAGMMTLLICCVFLLACQVKDLGM
jgi:hypothetical protein